jgi:uncharacterized repeat protein (TIGR02543 family)
MLRRLPLLRYLKEPAERVEELYVRYPMGGHPGDFAWVHSAETFAYWYDPVREWRLLSCDAGGSGTGYRIFYDGSGASVGVPSDANRYEAGTDVFIFNQSMNKPGYSFAGWRDNHAEPAFAGIKQSGETFTMPARDVELTAAWQADSYSYVIDNAGATEAQTGGTPAGLTPYGAQVYSPEAAPSRTGYRFGGWYEAGMNPVFTGYRETFNFAMPARDVTITAKWYTEDYYYHVNDDGPLQASAGGTIPNTRNGVSMGGISPHQMGDIITLPTLKPTKNGYRFGGWSRSDGEANIGADATSFTMPASDITITAIWLSTDRHLTYDMNGGNTAYDTRYYDSEAERYVPLDEINYPYNTGDTVSVYPGLPTHSSGEGFAGWSRWDNGADTGLVYLPGGTFTMPAADVELRATWQADTYLYYVNDNGATTPPSGGTPFPSALPVNTTVTLPVTDPEKSVTGKEHNVQVAHMAVFVGWADALGLNINALWSGYKQGGETFTMPARDMGAVAVFGYEYTLDLNGGTGASGGSSSGVYFVLAEVSLPTTPPVRPGFVFAGWKRLDTDTMVAVGGISMPGYHVTVQAQWEASSGYSAGYNSNGGTAPPATQTGLNENDVVTLPDYS